MTKCERTRRAALLCCHFMRNLAYFRVGSAKLSLEKEGDFWITAVGNFIDVSVLEWSKLFGNDSDKHHWKNIVLDKNDFKHRLSDALDITQADWDQAWQEIKAYRDEFVAHLDSKHEMNVPNMDLPKRMVEFYFYELSNCCSDPDVFVNIPEDIEEYYCNNCDEADLILADN